MRIKNAGPMSVALAILLLMLPMLGAGCDFINEEVIPTIKSPEINNPLSFNNIGVKNIDGELPPEFDILAEAWKQLSEDYVDKSKLDPTKLSQGAVKGMVEALDDPYSGYVDPENKELEMSTFEGKFDGIGAVISMKDKQLTIVAPIADSPAEKAGIKAGDKILEIDGQSTSKLTLIEATLKIRGPKGTSVKLLVLHEGETEPVEIQIVRGEIKVESVFLEMRDDIAYIRLTQFLKSTGGELQGVLNEAIDKGAKGVVLDLRNNPGGLLNAATEVASQFLAMGMVAKVVDDEGRESPVAVKRGGIATYLPLIVLVNKGSASGSEIVAGALQDYGRAKLAGSQTFGKGSVQVVRDLSDGSALHITAYRWLTPFGRPIDGVGLKPDFVLELEDEELVDWAIQYLKGQIKTELLPVFAS
ncbi:MAG: S41 family peptidase [Chloroflexi bacterium]|nr:S41 family peptidase [Chloroflexota bacterium]